MVIKNSSIGSSHFQLVFLLLLLLSTDHLAGQNSVAHIADKAGIIQEPVPHLSGSTVLTLPIGVALPAEMTYPKQGSIYAVQLHQEEAFWKKEIAATPAQRDGVWHAELASAASYRASLRARRNHLSKLLGLVAFDPKQIQAQTVLLNSGPVRVEELNLTFEDGLPARAIVLVPDGTITGAVLALPDAEESNEKFTGMAEGDSPASWLASLLARHLVVCVAVTVERKTDFAWGRSHHIDRREFLYRLGFIVGRTLIGLEVQQTLGLRDYLTTRFSLNEKQVTLLGDRQGGMTAFYAAAVDKGFAGVAIIDYFQQRENCWNEPVDRMIYGQLNEFGDAEVAALIAPRPLNILYTKSAALPVAHIQAEFDRARRFYSVLGNTHPLTMAEAPDDQALSIAAEHVAGPLTASSPSSVPNLPFHLSAAEGDKLRNSHFDALHTYLRKLDAQSDAVRNDHWRLLSTPPAARAGQSEAIRRELTNLMGVVSRGSEPIEPRTRLIKLTDNFAAYDVLLRALPGVDVYGQLLVPRNREGRLPVVICQHGLGGRPTDITGVGEAPEPIYHALGAHLADLGYVVFAPYLTVPIKQEILVNPLVRMAATLGKMRTSLELAKLHAVVDFLTSLPVVDRDRIGYYGLSYGGYSATWMPPLESRIRASVISGHFNDWRTKITDEEKSTSYLVHPDADFFNWNVLNRFTHVELIAAMWPRPVCVEFGDRDGTTTPEWHARAWQQVSDYADAWGLGGLDAKIFRVQYSGIHEIHGVGTIDFLNRWLRPNAPAVRDHSYNLLPASVELQASQGPLEYGQGSALPLAEHTLDSSMKTVVNGRFYVPRESTLFRGLALKLSRASHPGDLIVRFGTSENAADLGEARISANQIDPLFDLWYEAHIRPVRLEPSKLYFFALSAASGEAPHDYYTIYGPKPLGGEDIDLNFGASYRVLVGPTSSRPPKTEERFEFMRTMLGPYEGGAIVQRAIAGASRPDEVGLDSSWSICAHSGAGEVVETAANGLQQFLRNNLQIPLKRTTADAIPKIDLRVLPAGVDGVNTAEGYRISVSARDVTIESITPRGVMRGVYELEDGIRLRHAPLLQTGTTVRNCRFARRITTAVHPGEGMYKETSQPLPYTDGLLQRISHSGFNALWVWVNSEELTLDSKVFPELNDSAAAIRLDRLIDLTERARRYGIDIYVYFGTGYNHHLPESFFQKHPEARGYGWGPPMCTSTESVRRYYAETVSTLFRHAPLLKGMIIIYDSEGFWYCGNSERNLRQCPRCSRRTQPEVAAEILKTLDDAMHDSGGRDKELIAWNYNVASQWVLKLFPLLPKDIIVQADFDKGMIVDKHGIRHQTEDYNISNVGPPELFVQEYEAARAQGLTVMAKTEHAVSQEFIFVPYIPCMEQWYRRAAAMREYSMGGWFGNWNHYGYTPSRPAELINRMSFDPAPSMEQLLQAQAERDFGGAAAPYILRAWHQFSEAIRSYPYSDAIARVPGPLQKGPSQPLFLDPDVKSFGSWRSWQNDLKWTRPWGQQIAATDLGQVEQFLLSGDAELESARHVAPAAYGSTIDSEWRVGRTLQTAVQTVLNLIKWVPVRDDFEAAKSELQRQELAPKLQSVILDERSNASGLLPLLRVDSRLGYAAVGAGGLFSPALVDWKIGYADDVLIRQMPADIDTKATNQQ